jgi:hypothetical protein
MRRVPIVALVTAAVVAGCGGSHRPDARARVDAYVQRANAIQRDAADGYRRANVAYAAFSKGRLRPHRAAIRLQDAERAITSARRRLEALRPPAEARVLHQRLLRYFGLGTRIARQSTLLARYQAGAPAAMAGLTRANVRLRHDLAGAGPAARAAALTAFGSTTQRTLNRLRRLQAPDVLRAAHEQQLRRLEHTRALARRLREAVLADDAKALARLVLRFRRSLTASDGIRQDAERAVAAYEHRLRGLARAYSAVRREQIRLDRSLR